MKNQTSVSGTSAVNNVDQLEALKQERNKLKAVIQQQLVEISALIESRNN